MSDVRDELARAIQGERERWTDGRYVSSVEIAAAILERFDVTPKPVISDEELGRMVNTAKLCCGPGTDLVAGERFRKALTKAGLEIVRKEAGE